MEFIKLFFEIIKHFYKYFIYAICVLSLFVSCLISIYLFNCLINTNASNNNIEQNKRIETLEKQLLTFEQQIIFEYNKCELEEFILTEKRINAIMDKSNNQLTVEQKREYIKYITLYSKKYSLSPILVASVIHRESNFRNKVTSNVGAAGPMQVWAKWHPEKLKKHKLTSEHLYSTKYGILIGCEVLKEYIDREDGNFRAALYRYVGGNHHGYVNDIFAMCEYAFSIKL